MKKHRKKHHANTKFRTSSSRRSGGVNSVHPNNEFHELIEIERLRSHRIDGKFSIILINVGNETVNEPPVLQLIDKITKRIREIDQVGWYDQERIGIILPNTDSIGAKVIAAELSKKDEENQIDFPFETLSYPFAL